MIATLRSSQELHLEKEKAMAQHRLLVGLASVAIATLGVSSPIYAGDIFGFSGSTIGGGFRWDAAPRTINLSGTNYERSLDGGIRYSLQGGSFQAYRDQFTWSVTPTVPEFQTAVQQAFDAWKSVDPVSGFGSTLNFVPDLATPVVGTGAGNVNPRGAEIDLLAATSAGSWGFGSTGTQGETYFQAIGSTVTLTSGTVNYAGSGAISGADITLNNNAGAVYNLNIFRRLLTHEIGHAIGLGDVEGSINPNAFIDDNYDGTNAATALATLTNNWVAQVNILNPAASPLFRFTPGANPGTSTTGVDILMESFGLGIGASNPVTNLVPLSNDDYNTRQFLYPVAIPEPSTYVLICAGIGGAGFYGWKRRRQQNELESKSCSIAR